MVDFAEIFRIEIRAYCVMINHVHIHLRTQEANLGAYMRSFLTSFTSMYHHRHGSCGHVFQGRYKAFILEDAKPYTGKVSQYIHLNPVRIRTHEDKPLDVRHEIALGFPWSSLEIALMSFSFLTGSTLTFDPFFKPFFCVPMITPSMFSL